MTQAVRLRVVTVFALIAAVASIGLTAFAYRRANTLQSLRLEADGALQSMYRLSNTTYSLLYAAPDMSTAYDVWQEEFNQAYELLDQLSFHPGLTVLGRQVEQRVRQTRNLWTITTNGFVSGGDLLESFLQLELELATLQVELTNVADVLDQMSATAAAREMGENFQSALFSLRRAYLEIDATNEQFWFFTTSALEGFGDEIQTEADRVTRLTVLTSSILAVVLLALVLIALLTSLRFLHTANATLEENVRERTQSLQNLLDFSGEGFISFGPDLLIRPEISRECESIFGRSAVGQNVAQVLFEEPQKRTDFADAMELVFTGNSDPDVIFDVLDRKTRIGDKTVEINLRMVDDSTIMCLLRDITETEALQKEMSDQNEKREMVLRIVTARPYFLSLLEEAAELFGALEGHVSGGDFAAEESEVQELVRSLHTFKSNAAFLRMRRTTHFAHELETALVDYELLQESAAVGPTIAEFRRSFNQEVSFVKDALGENWVSESNVQEVDGEALQDIFEYVRQQHPEDAQLIADLDHISRVPLSDLFSRMADLANQLALSRGKQVNVEVLTDEIRVPRYVYQSLSDAMSHLVRNMVDHGIEFPRHREKAGKDPRGVIKIESSSVDGEIRIKIGDDGAGIATEKVKARAREKGLIADDQTPTPQDLIRMVFTHGFSTAEAVTPVSGRGFGLSAVHDHVKEIGGRVGVSTKKGRGTQFTLVIPNPDGTTGTIGAATVAERT